MEIKVKEQLDYTYIKIVSDLFNTLIATLVIGDRSAWTSDNCENSMKIDSQGILNITNK